MASPISCPLSLFPSLALLLLFSSPLIHADPELVKRFCVDLETAFQKDGADYCRQCLNTHPESKDAEYNDLIDILLECGLSSMNLFRDITYKLAATETDPVMKEKLEFCGDNTRWGTSMIGICREYLDGKNYRAGASAVITAQEATYLPCVRRFGETTNVPGQLMNEMKYFYYMCDDAGRVLTNLADGDGGRTTGSMIERSKNP